MPILDQYNAQWIYTPRQENETPAFRKDIVIQHKVAFATISLCGLGQFALFVGDTAINPGILEPGWTHYAKRCLYSEYDITHALHPGENRITVLIGNGMYHVSGTRYTKFTGSMGDPTLIACLQVTYANGQAEQWVTGEDWLWCPSPIIHSCIYGGEDFDARRDAWKLPTALRMQAWTHCQVWDGPGGKLEKAQQPPVCIQDYLVPIVQKELSPGKYWVDFGRNFAGRIQIRVQGNAGETATITPGELINNDESINQSFSGAPHTYTYTLAGGEPEAYLPYFTFYGQRYAVVETSAKVLEVTGVESYTACPEAGSFTCSNALYNNIHQMILGAIRSNMQSVFTDCPHREKLGWQEQLHLIGPGVLYDYDAKTLLAKVLQDMEDAQTPEGLVPDICPEYVEFELGFRDSPEWGSSCVLVPWLLYERYGDKDLLAAHYSMSVKYVDYLLSKAENYILNFGLGDWLDVGHYDSHPALTPIPNVASALLVHDLMVMEKTARALGCKDDAARYTRCYVEAKTAYNHAFYYPLSGNYGTGSQTSNAMPLLLQIPEEKEAPRVLRRLIQNIHNKGDHLDGGDIGHPYILRTLHACGQDALVAKIMNRTDFPSYGNMVQLGATTLCEDWDGADPERPEASQNHFMLGAGEEWFYNALAGAKIDMSQPTPLTIKPCFPTEVDWVNASVTVGGKKVNFGWEKNGTEAKITVHLPQGLAVKLVMPGTEQTEAAGKARTVIMQGRL